MLPVAHGQALAAHRFGNYRHGHRHRLQNLDAHAAAGEQRHGQRARSNPERLGAGDIAVQVYARTAFGQHLQCTRWAGAHNIVGEIRAQFAQIVIALLEPPDHALAVRRPEHRADGKEAVGLRRTRGIDIGKARSVNRNRDHLYWHRASGDHAQRLAVMLAHCQHHLRTPASLTLHLASEPHLAPEQPARQGIAGTLAQPLDHLPDSVMLIEDNGAGPVARNEAHHVQLVDVQHIDLLFLQEQAHQRLHLGAVIAAQDERVAREQALKHKTRIAEPRAFDRDRLYPAADIAQHPGVANLLGAAHKRAVHHLVVRGQVAQDLERLNLGAGVGWIDNNLCQYEYPHYICPFHLSALAAIVPTWAAIACW